MATEPAMHNERVNLNSSTGGVQLVTIAGSPVTIAATDQPCRYCYVQLKSGTACFMNIGAAATTSSFTIPKVGVVPALKVTVDDLNLLNFIGTAGDIVQILWFN